jgi:hypothetical protein
MYGNCSECQAFKFSTNPSGEIVKQCRRHHPGQVLVIVGPTGAQVTISWPQTDEKQGCCDFLPMLSS